MNRARILKLEEKLRPVATCRQIDEYGWHLIGGGLRAAGVLRVPPQMTEDEWTRAGK